MYAAEAKVALFILDNPEKALESNVSETAELSGVSDATVVRFCKRLGYEGFYQMKLQLSHDFGKKQQSTTSPAEKGSPRDVLESVSRLIASMGQRIDPKLLMNVVKSIDKSDMVYVIGSGQSRILSNYILFRLSRLGFRTTGGNFAEIDIENISYGNDTDVVICISHSGETKRTLQAIKIGALRGMTTIALTDSEKNPLSQSADYSLASGIWNRQEFDNSPESFIYMLAIIDTVFSFLSKRKRVNDEIIADCITASRM